MYVDIGRSLSTDYFLIADQLTDTTLRLAGGSFGLPGAFALLR